MRTILASPPTENTRSLFCLLEKNGLWVVATKSTLEESLAALAILDCTYLFLDVRLIEPNIPQAIEQIRTQAPHIKLILTVPLSFSVTAELMELAIDGLLLQPCTKTMLLDTLNTVHAI